MRPADLDPTNRAAGDTVSGRRTWCSHPYGSGDAVGMFVAAIFISVAIVVAGARGVMRLMPGTFREVASKNPELTRIDDAASNIMASIA